MPMGAAIWSTPVDVMRTIRPTPLSAFATITACCEFQTAPNGEPSSAAARVKRLTAPYPTPFIQTARSESLEDAGAHVAVRGGTVHRFDQVVLASHADQTLKMFDRPGRGTKASGNL